jgi:hypothetical protein
MMNMKFAETVAWYYQQKMMKGSMMPIKPKVDWFCLAFPNVNQ